MANDVVNEAGFNVHKLEEYSVGILIAMFFILVLYKVLI
jgi:hypothetical protein